jgi:small conductance mechanosensitive channel
VKTWDKFINRLWDEVTNEDLWLSIGEGALKILLTVLLASVVIRIGKAMIRNIFKLRAKSPLTFSERRENTLLKLLENILTYVVYFIAFVNILSIMTFDIKGLIAGAGVVGLAVGFGAQSLVKDVITGFFIIFEDQFSVGDYIRIGNFEGYVEEIGLRTTKIKSWTGELHILPNGSITEVTNFSLNNSIAIVDVTVAYEENIVEVERIIEDLLKTLPEKYEELVAPPELLGIQNLGSTEVVLRIIAETTPMNHLYIARMIRKEVKLCLDQKGIEIPFPRLVMYSREEKENMVRKKDMGKS